MIVIVSCIAAVLGVMFGAELAAVFGMGVAVGGVECLFETEAALTGEAEGVGTIDDDFVAGQKALFDLDELIILGSEDDGAFHESVFELVVFDKDEAVGGISLHGGAGDGHDVLALLDGDTLPACRCILDSSQTLNVGT